MSISASEARKTLFPLIELMPADGYAAWQETAYLFRSPANARRLVDAYERARTGKTEARDLDEARDRRERPSDAAVPRTSASSGWAWISRSG
ncbi:type II toxin-antitoxin system Phd/YefM family antitoxin [Streptomyces oceani]|uniref:type II toxin-antitoxin system Phd/YefM family antitoxin n=1 Tax=Streptomyces oceani TaxID=1075402 RepID=UPI000A977ED5|nr:type II toxin-antitoxin system prevent-host-death family antitoxin [Streptomyces oceani]